MLRHLLEGEGSFEAVPGRLAACGRCVAGLEGRLRKKTGWAVPPLETTDQEVGRCSFFKMQNSLIGGSRGLGEVCWECVQVRKLRR